MKKQTKEITQEIQVTNYNLGDRDNCIKFLYQIRLFAKLVDIQNIKTSKKTVNKMKTCFTDTAKETPR